MSKSLWSKPNCSNGSRLIALTFAEINHIKTVFTCIIAVGPRLTGRPLPMTPPIEKLGSPDQMLSADTEIGSPAFFELLPPMDSFMVEPTGLVRAFWAACGSQK